jgi:hypothetical protein
MMPEHPAGDRAMTLFRRALPLIVILAGLAGLSISAGLTDAYVAADDFQWLAGGHTFGWSRVLQLTGRDHFYRPGADLWFATTTSACGFRLGCHHSALLLVHLLNVSLVYVLCSWLSRDMRFAFLATLLFAVQPAHTHAIVWLSAITIVLASFGYLSALVTLVASWRSDPRHRPGLELLAVGFFLLAVFSHEAAITLPVLALIMSRSFGPRDAAGRPIPLVGTAVVVAMFVATTLIANRANQVFTSSGYALGSHSVRHALDYIVSLYVGPSWWLPHVVIVIVLVVMLRLSTLTRFGVLWLLISMIPYLPFTSGNASRYAYLPAIGFSLAVAGAVTLAADTLQPSRRIPRAVSAAVYTLAMLFFVVRFAPFAFASVRSHVRAMEEWRSAAATILQAVESDGRVIAIGPVAPQSGAAVERMYVEPLVRWELRDYTSRVTIEGS